MPWVAAAVLPLQLLKPVQPENFLRRPRLLQPGNQPVSLRVEIRADVVSHLARGITQTHFLIECDGAKPNFFPLMKPVPVPESDVMPLTWAVSHGLLESKILFAAKQFERAHRRIRVRVAEDRINRNPEAAAERQRVGGVPLCLEHGPNHIRLRTEQRHIYWVAGNSVGRMRDARRVKQRRMPARKSRNAASRTSAVISGRGKGNRPTEASMRA